MSENNREVRPLSRSSPISISSLLNQQASTTLQLLFTTDHHNAN
jgi:hypothetical protein